VAVSAACAVVLGSTATPSASAAFGIDAFSIDFQSDSGAPLNRAGARADMRIGLDFNETHAPDGTVVMDGQLRDLEVRLPAGLFGNPEAVPGCTMEQMVLGNGFCSPAAQVGVLNVVGYDWPVYNMRAPDEQTAVLAVAVVGVVAKIVISIRGGDQGMIATLSNANQAFPLTHSSLVLWGVPAGSVHDDERFGSDGLFDTGYPAGIEPKPFLSLPTRCTPLRTVVRADSWQEPGVWAGAEAETPSLTGCDELDFSPTLKARPTTDAADSPSGLDVDLQVPQNEAPAGRASAHLRDFELTLPEGLVINPAGANGVGVCSPEQIGLTSAPASGKATFGDGDPSCPDASRLGTVEVEVPAFADPLRGSVFAATPSRNPFGDLLALYVVIEGPGLLIKLAAELDPDPRSGRLAISLLENPQLPVERFRLRLFGGPRALLRTPATCGTYSASSRLTSWSAPESAPPAAPGDTYAISRGPGGGDCARSPAALPSAVSFDAGSATPLAGAFTPFVVNLRREDGTQQLTAISFALPPGLLAKLTGTDTCSAAALATAESKSGAEEAAAPSCPPGSAVGSVHLAAGAGPEPYNLPGKIYLAGPYKGAPLSLAIVTSALAGPFDLGTVVVRAALDVDLATARVGIRSDLLPLIRAGVPLDLRSVLIDLDKPNFTRNPTSCDPMAVTGAALSSIGAVTPLSIRFQLAECSRLAFEPRVSLGVSGGVARNAHPRIDVRLIAPAAGANLSAAAFTLPAGELLDVRNLGALCPRRLAPAQCPRGSRIGRARISSPLLAKPLQGAIYLRVPSARLPDLTADLRGADLRYVLHGQTTARAGRLGIRLPDLPDLPLSKATITLAGAHEGIFVNSESLCARSRRASVDLSAHNGAQKRLRPLLRLPASC
jgi:hypothetical protein